MATTLKNLYVKPGDALPAPKEFKLLGLQWEPDGACRLLVLAVSEVATETGAPPPTAALRLFPATPRAGTAERPS